MKIVDNLTIRQSSKMSNKTNTEIPKETTTETEVHDSGPGWCTVPDDSKPLSLNDDLMTPEITHITTPVLFT